jgi:hypothetical protein
MKQTMKITLTTEQIAQSLRLYSENAWTYEGSLEIATWLQENEEHAGEEFEFDAAAIHGAFSEFKTATEAAQNFGWAPDETEFDAANEAAAVSWLEMRTDVRIFPYGIIVVSF